MSQNRMYGEIASWFHLLTAPEEYAEEAGIYRQTLQRALPDARTMLELGSGGGNNASHLKQYYEMTLVDLSPGMLKLSQKLNPELEHLQGDMRTVHLERLFDIVFIHDAISYMTNLDDLRLAIRTASVHSRPGGVVLMVPDDTCETFKPSTDCGGNDGISRSMRYLEWKWDPDPTDSTYLVDYAYLLREADGPVQALTDRHTCGLFSREQWLALMQQEGLRAQMLPFEHSEVEPGSIVMFLGLKA